MKNPHPEKNFKLRLVKYFLFWYLSLLMMQGMLCEVNYAVNISFSIVHSLKFSSSTISSFVVYLVAENEK